jgi:hypothetical protein
VNLATVLAQAMKGLGVNETNRAWAEKLGEDPSTLSKVLSGTLTLTDGRAEKWASALYGADQTQAAEFQQIIITAASVSRFTVRDFCDEAIAANGILPALRIRDLFTALLNEKHQILCIEYRDKPRTSPGTKYQTLGHHLAWVISKGICLAMFQPFADINDIPKPSYRKRPEQDTDSAIATVTVEAANYMGEIRDACRAAYHAFREDAEEQYVDQLEEAAKRKGEKFVRDDQAIWDQAKEAIADRIKLYEGHACSTCASTGFGAKMFYIQWMDENKIRHKRIFEWVSTPKEDWLIYRGEADINEDALRDSFYPVPHFFDVEGRLPADKQFNAQSKDMEAVREGWPGFAHPNAAKFQTWKLSQECYNA